jgi:hypothetical protein
MYSLVGVIPFVQEIYDDDVVCLSVAMAAANAL